MNTVTDNSAPEESKNNTPHDSSYTGDDKGVVDKGKKGTKFGAPAKDKRTTSRAKETNSNRDMRVNLFKSII